MKRSAYLSMLIGWMGLGALSAQPVQQPALHPLQIEWQAVFGGTRADIPRKVVALHDGGFVIGTISYSGSSGNKTAPKYSASGEAPDAWLLKVDEAGQRAWDVNFGGTNGTGLVSLAERQDGSLIVLTTSADGVSGNRGIPNRLRNGFPGDVWVIIVDSKGQKLYEVAYQGDNPGAGLALASDGGFAFAGETTSCGVFPCENVLAWIVRADAQGEVMWERKINTGKQAEFRALAQTPDGGFVCAGTTFITDEETGNDLRVGLWVRFSASGEELWRRIENDSVLRDANTRVIVTDDGGFLNGGSSFPADFQVVKRDAGGNVLWAGNPGSPRHQEQVHDLLPLRDGGFLLFGEADGAAHGFPNPLLDGTRTARFWGLQDYWLVRFDRNMRLLWDESFGGDKVQFGYSLAQAADGGYLLVGTSWSGVSGLKTLPNFGTAVGGVFPEDIWVVKISPDIFPARSNSVELAVAPAFSRNIERQGMRLSLTGVSNRLHLVEVSTNLVQWSMVSTNWIGSYGTMVVDTNATPQTQRFYRARTLDP